MIKNNANKGIKAPPLSEELANPRPAFSQEYTMPQLVLDIGGVLATNLAPRFWRMIADASSLDQEQLYADYKKDIGPGLWRGTVSEDQFWEWLDGKTESIGAERYRAFLNECLVPLPALSMLAEWRLHADIHILSNHVQSWVLPLLEPFRASLGHVIISSAIGYEKPQPELFQTAAKLLPPGSPVLFVDDSPKNLLQAQQSGWHVLHADENGLWTKQVRQWLLNAPVLRN
ncbi:HAD family hydrolase [Paenibacillus sp. CAU 1782]